MTAWPAIPFLLLSTSLWSCGGGSGPWVYLLVLGLLGAGLFWLFRRRGARPGATASPSPTKVTEPPPSQARSDPGPSDDETHRSPHHYQLVHHALRQIAQETPTFFFGVMASPDRPRFLQSLWERVCEHLADEKHGEPGFSIEEVNIHLLKIRDFPTVIVEMPTPRKMTEAYFAAAVLLHPLSAPGPEPETLTVRFITLELSFHHETGAAFTFLCEWQQGRTHSNYGYGPPPELPAFLMAVEQLLTPIEEAN